MSITTHRSTRKVKIGNLTLGGDSPIIVQSMAKVPTWDIDRCLQQIERMVLNGCELVRLAVPTAKDTAAIEEIVRRASVPIIADVHFHYSRALEAIEAGVSKIRLNPGNISNRKEVEEVIAACKANDVAIRIGVNQGSIQPRRKGRVLQAELEQDMVTLMVGKLTEYVEIFEENHFDNLVLSAKCHDAASNITVNRAISKKFDYPLHLGVTHAGITPAGDIRSAVALGTLLAGPAVPAWGGTARIGE